MKKIKKEEYPIDELTMVKKTVGALLHTIVSQLAKPGVHNNEQIALLHDQIYQYLERI